MFLGYSDTKAQDVETCHFKVTESLGKVVGTPLCIWKVFG